jgi:hypothetical protein
MLGRASLLDAVTRTGQFAEWESNLQESRMLLTPSAARGAIPTTPLHFLMRFVKLSSEEALHLIKKNHYLHRACPISHSWGIRLSDSDFFTDNEAFGCLTIGKLCSWSTCCGLVGEKKDHLDKPAARNHDVYELNRLWLSDSLPAHTESRFIGWCLRELKKTRPNIILVSYADTAHDHVGVVYQATNWIYTGLSVPFNDLASYELNHPAQYKRSDHTGERSRKHRYVWFANPADRPLLKWNVQPYPKKLKRTLS